MMELLRGEVRYPGRARPGSGIYIIYFNLLCRFLVEAEYSAPCITDYFLLQYYWSSRRASRTEFWKIYRTAQNRYRPGFAVPAPEPVQSRHNPAGSSPKNPWIFLYSTPPERRRDIQSWKTGEFALYQGFDPKLLVETEQLILSSRNGLSRTLTCLILGFTTGQLRGRYM